MRIITLTAVAIFALVAAHGARADGVCMTAADLAFAPAIARALPVIDTEHKGCVSGEQVQRYRAAVKQARTEEKARIVTLLASAN